jgi:hypothetical protein
MPAFPPLPAFAATQPTEEQAIAGAQTFKLGAAVLLDGSQNIAECGADPAAIRGFAAHPANLGIPTTKVLVWKAWEGQQFYMSGTSAPAKANIGVNYGVVKDSDGIWTVDLTDVVNTRVHVHNVDLDRNLYLVSILAANRQIAP